MDVDVDVAASGDEARSVGLLASGAVVVLLNEARSSEAQVYVACVLRIKIVSFIGRDRLCVQKCR